jgi:UDP-3-O-[3-hydroxymyristoyl] glucosamine N-acyltransferase
VIAAQTGVSGSSKIAENVILGGQVGIVGHISVADRSQVQAQAGINRTITEANKKWAGSPVLAYQSNMRSQVIYAKLPDLEKRVRELERLLKENLKS